MKKIIFGIFLLGFIRTGAQSLDRDVLASAGAYSQASGLTLSYTIGEVAVSTLTGASSIMTQGFQQPDGLFVGIVDPLSGHVTWSAYPNPVSEILKLEIGSSTNDELIISCNDLLGRTVLPLQYLDVIRGETSHVEMDVRHLTPAMYFVRIMRKADGIPMETIRIVKSH